jgi:hypothetical protein
VRRSAGDDFVAGMRRALWLAAAAVVVSIVIGLRGIGADRS